MTQHPKMPLSEKWLLNRHQTKSYINASLGIAHFVILLKTEIANVKLCLLQTPYPFFSYHSIEKSKSTYIFFYCLSSFAYVNLNFATTASPKHALKLLQSELLKQYYSMKKQFERSEYIFFTQKIDFAIFVFLLTRSISKRKKFCVNFFLSIEHQNNFYHVTFFIQLRTDPDVPFIPMRLSMEHLAR